VTGPQRRDGPRAALTKSKADIQPALPTFLPLSSVIGVDAFLKASATRDEWFTKELHLHLSVLLAPEARAVAVQNSLRT